MNLPKPTRPAPAMPSVKPARQAAIDCASCGGIDKTCSMNCSTSISDYRNKIHLMRDCDDCEAGCRTCEARVKSVACALQQSDAARFEWALPIIAGSDEAVADIRANALAGALLGGFGGRDAVDQAMKASRTKEQQ